MLITALSRCCYGNCVSSETAKQIMPITIALDLIAGLAVAALAITSIYNTSIFPISDGLNAGIALMGALYTIVSSSMICCFKEKEI
jgi:hypothetical protein